MSDTKMCKHKKGCGRIKPVTEFFLDRGYRTTICKACRKIEQRKAYFKRTENTNVKRQKKTSEVVEELLPRRIRIRNDIKEFFDTKYNKDKR